MNINILSTLPQSNKTILFPFFKGEIDTDKIKAASGIEFLPEFKGEFKETVILHHPNQSLQVFLLGLGEEKDLSKMAQAIRSLAFKNHKKWDGSITVDLSHLPVQAVLNIALGMQLATYQVGMFKTNEKEAAVFYKDDFELSIIHSNEKAGKLAEEGKLTAETMINIMRLVDSPANVKTPTYLGQHAFDSAQKYGYKAEILNKAQLEEENLAALLAVGRGSSRPPVLIKLEYKPEGMDSNRPKLGLVGKGITFDTGGISIKSSNNMHYMKSDMGGAAAVLGAVELAAKLKLNIHIVGIVPSAENAVDANSINPGDVINSYSGKTIEIIDTDAEGRLILADGLAYIKKNYDPEFIIDLATLTGSSVMTLGYAAAALFSNNDQIVNSLSEIGQRIHEKVWRLPLWDDYVGDIHSDIADVRNFSGKPLAGAITAAKFLEFFIKDHSNWAHLDIAGVAFGDSEFTKMKSGSAYGVRLLVEYMKQLSL